VKSRNKLALVLCVVAMLTACAPAATVSEPTRALTPSVASSPTDLPPATPTPHPPLETLACPLEYTRYVARDLLCRLLLHRLDCNHTGGAGV
jgi:hypothetical protein